MKYKTSSRKRTKKFKAVIISVTLGIVLALTGALAAISVNLGKNNNLGGTLADTTAGPTNTPGVTASSGFGKLANSGKYYFTGVDSNYNPVANSTVTVDSSQAWGTEKNPYVISTVNDWVYFTQRIGAGDAKYNTAHFVINAGGVLDFGGKIIAPVGNPSQSFKGVLRGNGTVFKNAKIGYVSRSTYYESALFYKCSGSTVSDITLDKTCSSVLSTTFNYGSNRPIIAGFATFLENCTLVNCTNKMNVNVVNTTTTAEGSLIPTYGTCAGIANESSGSLTLVGCNYAGDINWKGHNGELTASDNGLYFAGYVDSVYPSGKPVTISACNMKSKWTLDRVGTAEYTLFCPAGTLGVLTIKNMVIEHDIVYGSYLNTPDYVLITNGTWAAGSKLTNVYCTGSIKNSSGTVVATNTTRGSIVSNTSMVDSSNKIHCDYGSNQGGHSNGNVSSNDTVKNDLKNDSTIRDHLNVGSDGSVSGTKTEAGATGSSIYYNIDYLFLMGGGKGTANLPTRYSTNVVSFASPTQSAPNARFDGWYLGVNGRKISNSNGLASHITLLSKWTLQSATETATPATVSYGTSATIKVKLTHTQVTNGNAEYEAYWTKQGSTAHISSTTGDNAITVSDDGSTFQIEFAKPTVAQSGDYVLHYRVKPTTKGIENGALDSGSEYTETVALTVNKQTVYKPVFDVSGAGYTYNGKEQTLKRTYGDAKQDLYTITGDKATNAGTYTAKVTLKDPANYKWVVAPTTGESGVFNFEWTIKKAKPTVLFTPTDRVAYVGQTIDKVPLTGTANYTDGDGNLVNIPGTFTWKTPSTIITNNGASASDMAFEAIALFTPTDTTNFESLERGKNPIVKQLYLNVKEISTDLQETLHTLPVDYGSNATFAIVDPDPATKQDKETVTFTFTENGAANTLTVEGPNGYTVQVCKNISSVGVPNTPIESGDAILKNFNADVTVYIGYTAEAVNYAVYHVRQYPNGNYETQSNILAASGNTDALAAMLTEKESYHDKKADEYVSTLGKAKTYVGYSFDRENTLSNVIVNGDGTTNVFIYYVRQAYTVTFTARGSNRPTQTKNFYYEQLLSAEGIVEPKKNYTDFAGWYYDEDYTREVQFGSDEMPDKNISLYAKFVALDYKIKFDMNTLYGGEAAQPDYAVNPDVVVGEISWDYAKLFEGYKLVDTGDGYELTYNTNNLTTNKSLTGILPKAEGYTFIGWYNAETGVQARTVAKITSTTKQEIVLVARWTPATYTVSFDTNGGSTIGSKQIKNLTEWTGVLPGAGNEPTRTGYKFVTWSPSAEEANKGVNELGEPIGLTVYDIGDGEHFSVYDFVNNFGDIYDNGDGTYNLGNVTLYAVWESCDVEIVADSSVEWGKYGSPSFVKDGKTLSASDRVKIGDEIELRVATNTGYTLKNIVVNGRSLADGVFKFTVGEYDGVKITVGAGFTLVNYTITYNTDGGKSTDATVVRRFTVESGDIALPSKLTKVGYRFAGWIYDDGDDAFTTTSTAEDLYGETLILNRSRVENLVLTAKWTAKSAPVYLYNAVYSGLYNKDEVDASRYKVVQDDNGNDIVTGTEIHIVNPERKSFDFIGWATSPSGAVMYPAVKGENSVAYTANAHEDDKGNLLNKNRLYAVWYVKGVDHIVMSADNNNCAYGGTITMSATPAQEYKTEVEGNRISLTYNWYQIFAGMYDNCFVEKVYVDPDGNTFYVDENGDVCGTEDKDGNLIEGEASSKKLTYKEFNAAAAEEGANQSCKLVATKSNIPADGENTQTFSISTVNESGMYVCVVTVVAVDAGGGNAQTTAGGYGEIEVTMKKAVYDNTALANSTKEYNASARNLAVVLADSNAGGSISGNTLTLPDGSIVKITYAYTLNGESVAEEAVIGAGVYGVKATFEFTDDKGNYEALNKLEAELTISPKALSDIKFSMTHEGAEASEKFTVDYDGKAYAVTAEIRDRLGLSADAPAVADTDDVKVVLEVYKNNNNGATKVTEPTIEAGSYYALIVGLDGADKDNYKLGTSKIQQNYEIKKASHDVSGITFADAEVTFDNELHDITIGLAEGYELPEGVSVSYTTEYTAEDPDFDVNDMLKPNTTEKDNGGRYAGVYKITAKFTDTDGNYETIADKVATLTIKKAKFFDFYDKAELLTNQGFADLTSEYIVNANYHPHIGGGKLCETANFAITYDYYKHESIESEVKQLIASGAYDDVAALEHIIEESGKYTIIANIEYVSSLYINNFEEIDAKETTIVYEIASGTVTGIEIVFADGYEKKAQTGEEFDLANIAKIIVDYGEAGKSEITAEDRIATCTVSYGNKGTIPQATFWHVGTLPLTFTFYGKEASVDFTVTQAIENVTLKYRGSAEDAYGDIPEDGLDISGKSGYEFQIVYACIDEAGNKISKTTAIAVANLVRGENVLTPVAETYYTFDSAEISVNIYRTIEDEDVVWQYSADNGSNWKALGEDGLPYIGREYLIRVQFTGDDGKLTTAAAHTYSGLPVCNYKNGDYHMEVAMSDSYKFTARRDVTVNKTVLSFTWDNDEFVYTGGHRKPTATATNMAESDKDLINVGYRFEDEDGRDLTSAQVVRVGKYTVYVVLTGDATALGNYTLEGSESASLLYEIIKADVSMTVTYEEATYGKNVTYAGNPQGLRGEALKAAFTDAAIPGEFAFIRNYDPSDNSFELFEREEDISALLKQGNVTINYVYTPDDSYNYNVYFGTVTLEVKAQTAKKGNNSLSVEFGEGATRFYLVNQTFSTIGINVYRVYESYYTENNKEYGRRDLLENGKDVNLKIGQYQAEGYKITEADLSGGNIILTATAAGGDNGTLKVPVTAKRPIKLEINATSEYNTEYYVGQEFSYADMQFRATFEDGSVVDNLTQGSITSDYDNVIFTVSQVGKQTVTFSFFDVTVTVEIEVKDKEELQVVYEESKKLAYKNGTELTPPAMRYLVDGKEVTEVEGVSYIVTVTGAANKLTVLGDYTVTYTFNVTNPRFIKPQPISIKVTVTEILYTVNYNAPTSSQLNHVYTGSNIVFEKGEIAEVIDIQTNEKLPARRYTREFSLNGETDESKWNVVEVGEYIVRVRVLVDGEEVWTDEYTYVVAMAENQATVSVKNIIAGGEIKPSVEASFGGETAKFQYRKEGSASWTTAIDTNVAGVYYVRAVISGTKNYKEYTSEEVRFTINNTSISSGKNDNDETIVEIGNEDKGVDPELVLNVEKKDNGSVSIKKHNVQEVYSITLTKNGEIADIKDAYTVKLLLSEELRGRDGIKIHIVDENGKVTEVKAEIKDGYAVFTTMQFGTFVISEQIATVPVGLIVGVSIGAVVAAGLIVACVLVFLKKKRGEQ